MIKTYKLGSLFDGSGGFPLAGSLCGIEPVWASEVEPYPIAVTRSRFPKMKHLGDISKIDGAKIEPVDIITFGSPCQDLSVAGKRAGLKHEANGDEETTRSGLFMEAVRIIKEMRKATNGKYPSFALWENVPGAFSSNKGEDFRIVLQELIQIVEPGAFMPPVPKSGWPYADHYWGDGWSLSYRVFDAQFWGVPQRRRRIHLVLDLRGERAGEVSFEREGVRGHFAQSGAAGQGIAGDAEDGSGKDDPEGDCGNCLTPWDVQSRRCFTVDGPWPALCGGEGGGHGYVCVPVPASDSGTFATIYAAYGTKWNGNAGAYNGENFVLDPMVDSNILDDQGGSQISVRYDWKSPTLRAEMHGNVPCVMEAAGFKAGNGAKANGIGWQEEVCPTLSAAPSGTNQAPTVCVKTWDARGNGDGNICNTITGDHENRVTDYTGVVVEKCGFAMQGFGDYKDCGVASGLKARDYKDATDLVVEEQPIVFDKEVYNSGANAAGGHYIAESGPAPSLRTEHPPGVCVRYIVRRLTPTECARLQGFPDKWGHPDAKESMTPLEVCFWAGVRNTYAEINGKERKQYTEEQILKWYNKLHTDSSEYKMWGNGIALPPALYVMQGIAEALNAETGELEETCAFEAKVMEPTDTRKKVAVRRVRGRGVL